MTSVDSLSTVEARAFAAGLREALAEVDEAIGGKRSRVGLTEAGRRIQAQVTAAETLAEVGPLRRPSAFRQSLIASFDQCPLTTRFKLESNLRQAPGQMGILGATGVLFHRFAAACINHMRSYGEHEIGVDQAFEILTVILAQRNVAADDVVHLPASEVHWLRSLCAGWAYRQEFAIERIVDVEESLTAEIEVVGPHDTRYLRTITGRPDLLLAGPGPDEATILDWKSGFAPPSRKQTPKPGEPEKEDKLSDMGYVQQIVYGWLVLRNFPLIQRVTEREVYVRQKNDRVREASVERWQMERIEDTLAAVVAQFDAALDDGPDSARWYPAPGMHCGYCPRPRDCPVKDELGIPSNDVEAQRLINEWMVAGRVREERVPYIKGYIDAHGPQPVAHSKGSRMVGWVPNKTGRGQRFKVYEPDDAPDSVDEFLAEVAREAGVLVDA